MHIVLTCAKQTEHPPGVASAERASCSKFFSLLSPSIRSIDCLLLSKSCVFTKSLYHVGSHSGGKRLQHYHRNYLVEAATELLWLLKTGSAPGPVHRRRRAVMRRACSESKARLWPTRNSQLFGPAQKSLTTPILFFPFEIRLTFWIRFGPGIGSSCRPGAGAAGPVTESPGADN